MAKQPKKPQRSGCPIAATLDLAGDRWTFVIMRDMVNGKTRFGEFIDSPEGIPTNILASRLKRMEQAGLIAKKPYQMKPERFDYHLTAKGEGLLPVLQAMCRWANKFVPGTWVPPKSFMARKL